MTTLEDTHLSRPYQALRATYFLVPLLAGLDKFANLLTYWPHYLSHAFARMIPLSPPGFLRVVGVVEIVAALLVAIRPRIGAYVVMAWLICIAINLISFGMFDIAVRDLAMAVGAYALAQLATVYAGATGRVRARPPVEAHV
jgi:hypothetical protein